MPKNESLSISTALITWWVLLIAGEVCHSIRPFGNDYFSVRFNSNKFPGVVTLRCKSDAEQWSNFPKERLNLTGLFDVEIVNCGFPNDASFRLLEHIDSLGLRKIGLLKFRSPKMPLKSDLLSGISVHTLEFHKCRRLTELPEQFHGLQIRGGFWATSTGLTEVPPEFFMNQENVTYVNLDFNRIERLNRTVFEALVSLKTLLLAQNRLTEIEEGLFDRLSDLRILDISYNRLKMLPPTIFANLKSLEILNMGNNNFTKLTDDLLRNQNESLKTFRMNYNQGIIITMPEGFFRNFCKLEIVELSGNQFTSVPADLFIGAKLLEYVNLSRNDLTELPDRIFADASNLKKLTLSNNRLKELPEDIFKKNVNLEELYLNNNQLTNITEGLLSSLYNLRTLHVSHNLLEDIKLKFCDGNDNRSLKYINMSYNNLNRYGFFANCINIETVDASNNNIHKILLNELINKQKLTVLNLAYNRIPKLPRTEIFQRIPSLSTLNLSNNQISSFDMTNFVVPNSKINVTVDLSNNPLYCDCNIYDFISFLEGKNTTTNFKLIVENMTCVGPAQLADYRVENVNSSELTCRRVSNATGDACNEPCTCYDNQGNNCLIVDCSNKKLKNVPPTILNSLNWSIVLDMSGNDLKITPALNRSYLLDVVSLDLSSNNISTVTLDVFSGSLRELQLHNNRIARLESNVIKYLTENTRLKKLTLHRNNWTCDCEASNFLQFVQTKLSTFQLDKVKCSGSNKLLSANEACKVNTGIIVGANLTIAFFAVALGTLAALYYKYQMEIKVWLYSKQLFLCFITEDELDKDKKYDAFISFSHKDEDFVINEIINKLEEGPNPYKLCVHSRDWLAGEWITEQIAQSVKESRRTIVVLSPNFLDSFWGRMEFRTAHNQAMTEGRARVILILYGDVGTTDSLDPELKAYLSMNTYLEWGDPWFWDKLRYALPHRYESTRHRTRNAFTNENHLAKMPMHARSSNCRVEIVQMPNVNAAIRDSSKLLEIEGEDDKRVVDYRMHSYEH